MFVLTLTGMSSIAQTVITIPAANTNGTSNRKPYGNYFGYERTHLLYTSTEVGSFGDITKIAFYVNSVSSPAASTPVIIKMKTTTNATVSAATYATASSGATSVWSGNITSAMLVAGTWVEVTLTTVSELCS